MLGDRKQLESSSLVLCLEGNPAWPSRRAGLCRRRGWQASLALGCRSSLAHLLLRAFLFQAFKAQRSFTGRVQGGRWSHEGDTSPCWAPGVGCKALPSCWEALCSLQQILGLVSRFRSPLDLTLESPDRNIKNTRSHSIYLLSQKSTSPNQRPNQA